MALRDEPMSEHGLLVLARMNPSPWLLMVWHVHASVSTRW